MRFFICLLVILVSFTGAVAQPFFSPAEVAYLQEQFLQSLEGNIPGNLIIVGTLPPDRIQGAVPANKLVEVDPIFVVSPAGSISETDKVRWNVAFSWGDHADAGYITSAPAETDPVFNASDVADITDTDQANWDATYNWFTAEVLETASIVITSGIGGNTTNYFFFVDGLLVDYVENP